LWLSAPLWPAEAADVASTAFEMPRHGEIVVSVRLNGAGPFRLLLDTGSSHTAISEDVARALGAPAVARTVVTSPIGSDARLVVRVDRLELGPLVTNGVLASVVRRSAIDPSGRIQGLIGQDVLARRRYTLDFLNRRIHWEAAAGGGPDRQSTFRLQLGGDRYLVELALADFMLRLVPDSGAGGLVLFERRGRPLPLMWRDSPGTVLATLHDRRFVRQVLIPELRVGSHTFRDLPAAVVSRPDTETRDDDGLLPLHLFRLVTFDGPAALLTVVH
jgi:hypothetical protein